MSLSLNYISDRVSVSEKVSVSASMSDIDSLTLSTLAGNQTRNIWISRLSGFLINLLGDGDSVYSGDSVWNFGDSCENVFDMYWESGENLLNILVVVIIFSPPSVVGSKVSGLRFRV